MPSPDLSAPPRLAPGLRIVRRGPHHLQVGLYADRRVLLPRTEEVEDTLTQLLHHRPLADDAATAAVLALLDEHGCLDRSRPSAGGTVAVLGQFDAPGLPDLAALLAHAGLSVAPSAGTADVVLVLSLGELDRDLLDPLIRTRTTHLVVRLLDGGALLGPFVVPGATACLRCVDAHQSVHDPAHVAVTSRYQQATALPREDGTADVLDAALVALALSWAARDLTAHLQGRQPATLSRTVRFGAQPGHREEISWLRHPDCGCCWTPHDPSSGTIGA